MALDWLAFDLFQNRNMYMFGLLFLLLLVWHPMMAAHIEDRGPSVHVLFPVGSGL